MRHRDARRGRPRPCGARRTSAASTSVTAPSAAGGEVGDLHRRPGRRVLEHAGPAEVVEVVAGALGMRPVGAEAGDRAVHERRGQIAAPMPSRPRRRAGSPSRTTSARAQSAQREFRRPSSGRRRPTPCRREALVPCRRRRRIGSPPGGSIRTTRAPSRRSSLPAKAIGQVPGELDDEDALERLRVGLHDTYSDRVLTDRSIARERPGRDRRPGARRSAG